MKRTERIGAIIKILTDTPNKSYTLQYFCDLFGAAKSSISEDIKSASEALRFTGGGYLETSAGAKGGVKFVPDISDEAVKALQKEFCERLSDPGRILGGNFIYTSDLFYDSQLIQQLACVFARKFRDCGADYVATVETKGIPLASRVAHLMNIPLVVVRREAKVSASTISAARMTGFSACRCQNVRLQAAAEFSLLMILCAEAAALSESPR